MVAVKRVLIEFYNAADGVTESFRRDGAPVGATTANILITLDNWRRAHLANQAHCSAFAAGAGTYYYGIVIVGMWHGRAYLFLYIESNRMVTFYRGYSIDPRHLSGYILSGLCFVCFLLLP